MTNVEWTPEYEIQLFFAMMNHKPVGINKHFEMMAIHDKLTASLNCEISSDSIWKKLETLYNLPALDESNKPQFLNDEIEFSLPEDSFSELIEEKLNSSEKAESKLRSKMSKKDDLKEEVSRKDKIDEEEDKETPRRSLKRGRDSSSKADSPASNRRRR